MQLALYGIYLFLAVFNAGNMTTLQIQHYGIYPFVGKENFKNYMQANNKSAVVPSILPAMLLLIVNIVLLFTRPVFMPDCNHSIPGIKYYCIGFNLCLAKKTSG